MTDTDAETTELDNTMRPDSLKEFIGQVRVRGQLQLILRAAQMDERTPDHILLSGPPGLGKTTLAMIVAREQSVELKQTSGPAIKTAGDLAAILMSIEAGDVLFIDEIHRMSSSATEMLYLAMEDYRIDIMTGKGPHAESIGIEIPRFTLVGATTRAGILPQPLRDRFGFIAHLDYYSTAELERVLERSAGLQDMRIDPDALTRLATCSRGTPRVANALLRRVRDYTRVHESDATLEAVESALELYEIDALGLDRMDRAVMRALLVIFNGGPVGVKSLAVSVNEDTETIENSIEPFLVRLEFLARTPRGRIALPAAWKYMGLTARA